MPIALICERFASAIVRFEPTGWNTPANRTGTPGSIPNGTMSSISNSKNRVVDRVTHWENLYAARPSEKQSWYEADPVVSLRLLSAAIQRGGRSVVDVGGGASTLVDRLIGFDLEHIAVLDISERALEVAQARLGSGAHKVDWIVADMAAVDDIGLFDIWHDRAVFHFLTDTGEREGYVQLCQRTVVPRGSLIRRAPR